jgi:hypothetical protein
MTPFNPIDDIPPEVLARARHLTTGDVAKVTGYSLGSVARWCNDGTLQAARVTRAGQWRITPFAVAVLAHEWGISLNWSLLEPES